MSIRDIIRDRRDGKVQSYGHFEELARSCLDGSATDYQLSAWLMAAYLNPLTPQETADLTLALARSGATLNLSRLPRPHVDKHSTGGVGDKTTIALLPILATCGATMVKISGRGLGITGGTVDKLSTIPGFRIDLSSGQMMEQAARIGLALSGQTSELAPADKVLYALRDATETVGSIPLMVASILCKKVAVGAETIVLDVKCGSGAYMKDLGQAELLARALKDAGAKLGLNLRTVVTDMKSPLGRTVGNALEVKEALETLKGDGVGRFSQFVRELGAVALEASGLAQDEKAARAMVERSIASGAAADKARQWIHSQGGNPGVLDNLGLLPRAPHVKEVLADRDGWVAGIDAGAVGEAAVRLGAGRKTKEDPIDPSAGVELMVEIGSKVRPGQVVAIVHGSKPAELERESAEILGAFQWSDQQVSASPLVLARI